MTKVRTVTARTFAKPSVCDASAPVPPAIRNPV
jgi:hypothetical protein